MSKWEPFSEISHTTVSDIKFSQNLTQKGYNVQDDPNNHFLNWGKNLDGQNNDWVLVKRSNIDGDEYFGGRNLSGKPNGKGVTIKKDGSILIGLYVDG